MKEIKLENGAYINADYIVTITDNTLENKTANKKTSIRMLNGIEVQTTLSVAQLRKLYKVKAK